MRPKLKSESNRIVRHLRIRKKVCGTPERPRLTIYPSLLHIEVQLVDDYAQKTLNL